MKIIVGFVLTRSRHIRELNTTVALCKKDVTDELVRNLRLTDLTDKSVCQECRKVYFRTIGK